MGLSNAERQRRWRQKQKETNSKEYKRKERERKRQAYVPHNLRSKEEIEEQKKKDRLKYLKRKKREAERKKQREANQDNSSPSTSYVTRSSERNPLVVSMQFRRKKRTPNTKKRYNTALRDAYRQIAKLADENNNLKKTIQREHKRVQKQKERARKVNKVTENVKDISPQMTPRSKTKLLIKKAGLKMNAKNPVYRQLVLGNTITESLKRSLKQYKRKQSQTTVLAMDLIKKYRCINSLSSKVGIARKKINTLYKQRVNSTMKQRYSNKVSEFLEREDNSTLQPGKKDTKTVGKVIHQKRVLNDYLHSIYAKFVAENPEVKISKTQFCKLRPPHILLTSFSSRRTCLCKYHQNFALKLKALRAVGIKCSVSPDVFLKEFPDDKAIEECMQSSLDPDRKTTYKKWKRVQQEDKYRWKEVQETIDKETFMTTVLKDTLEMRNHVDRIQNQYTEMRRLRENLREGDVMIWMDFAENFTCASQDEVQSAYWTTDMISLHTMVVYSQEGIQSYVAVSDSLTHNASAVYCIIQKLIPTLKERYPELKMIHYLTDSPTSQYRNKTIFEVLCHHEKDFGVKARWNYLEVGHGKGPCDGLGASVKRSADLAVRQGKCSIQDAKEFCKWASSNEQSKVKYILYEADDVKLAEDILNSKPAAITVQGTMKIHAVAPVDESTIASRELSCYCSECLEDVTTTRCKGWKQVPIVKKNADGERMMSVIDNLTESTESVNPIEPHNQTELTESEEKQNETNVLYEIDNWVAAVYDLEWYLGQVTDVDGDEVMVNFLTKAGKKSDTYKFPLSRDEIWLNKKDVLLVVQNLQPTGKSKRLFKLAEKDQKEIQASFDRSQLS